MKNAKDIIEWYKGYHLEDGVQVLLEKRQLLSCACAEVAKIEQQALANYIKARRNRKLKQANIELSAQGTGLKIKAKSIIETNEFQEIEDNYEAEAKGAKIIKDSWNKVLDSMASNINTLNR
jgi:hypothetical protein